MFLFLLTAGSHGYLCTQNDSATHTEEEHTDKMVLRIWYFLCGFNIIQCQNLLTDFAKVLLCAFFEVNFPSGLRWVILLQRYFWCVSIILCWHNFLSTDISMFRKSLIRNLKLPYLIVENKVGWHEDMYMVIHILLSLLPLERFK